MKYLTSYTQFSRLVTESLATTATRTESQLTTIVDKLIPQKAKARAKTYLGLDFNTLIKRVATTTTGIMSALGTKVNDPNFDPLTIQAEALKFEQALYALVNQEVNSIKAGLSLVDKGALGLAGGKLKTEFLAQNADSYGTVGTIVDSVISLLIETQRGDLGAAYSSQKQLLKAGKPVPPFTLRLKDRGGYKNVTFGKVGDHSFFTNKSATDGCYTQDYWEALEAQLVDRLPQITKTLVTNISTNLFS